MKGVNKGSIVNENDKKKFTELTQLPVEQQAQQFLRSFVIEFSGSFEEILDNAAEFRRYGSDDGQKEINELDEFQCHRFLEKRGETLTVKELREKIMKELDLDQNNRVSFIEYCLWKYKKTVHELFYETKVEKREITKDQVEKIHIDDFVEEDIVVERRRIVPTNEMIEELEKAMKSYQEALDVKRGREKRIHDLQQIVKAGGVKGLTAKNEIEQIEKQDLLEMNKREISSQSRKKIVQKKIEVYVQEQNKIEDERIKQEEIRLKQLQEERKKEVERLKQEEEERQKRELVRLKQEEEERVKREEERIKQEKEDKLRQEEERVRQEKERKEKEEEEKRRQSKDRLKQKASLWN